MITYTNSAIQTAQSCLRKYKFKYEDLIAEREIAQPLAYGLEFHRGLECYYLDKPFETTLTGIDAVQLNVSLAGYKARWASERHEVVAVERQFDITSRTGTWSLAGKLDLVVRKSTGLWLVEHKTTSSQIEPGGFYYQQKALDLQIGLYSLVFPSVFGEPLTGIIYDVIGKGFPPLLKANPSPRLRKDGKPYANQRTEDETLSEYQTRVSQAIISNPDKWYARYTFSRTASEIDAIRSDLLDWVGIIQLGKRPRSPNSCWQYNRPCEFFDICTGKTTESDPKYRRKEKAHEEL